MGWKMGERKTELQALAVSNIRRRGLNFVGGVAGLGLNVTASGARSWVLRYQVSGRRRDLGLGAYPDVTVAQAREAARAARASLRGGVDPIDAGRAARSRLAAAQASAVTFAEAAKRYIDAHESEWRNVKHAQQWRNTLETYAYPKIGRLFVSDVGRDHVLQVLEPIWRDKTETATRLRGRIECVLDWATVRGYREGDNPARWKGHLDTLLPAPGKIAKKEHHTALPYAQLPAFMRRLREHVGVGARALEFAVLTAVRSGEVRGAKWEEFDLETGVWTVPAERMKAGREHRVPLSSQALALIVAQRELAFCAHVFPSPVRGSVPVRGGGAEGGSADSPVRQASVVGSSESHEGRPAPLFGYGGMPLSDMTLSAVLKRMGVNAVPHGFRSTFRDWAAERTDYQREVAEMALAHAIGNKVEAAYRRGDLFAKRKQLMQDWADYASSAGGAEAKQEQAA
ncbi:MAG: integrase arm-type DNA-binding domain-containing protein [Burkholderiales bacterium]